MEIENREHYNEIAIETEDRRDALAHTLNNSETLKAMYKDPEHTVGIIADTLAGIRPDDENFNKQLMKKAVELNYLEQSEVKMVRENDAMADGVFNDVLMHYQGDAYREYHDMDLDLNGPEIRGVAVMNMLKEEGMHQAFGEITVSDLGGPEHAAMRKAQNSIGEEHDVVGTAIIGIAECEDTFKEIAEHEFAPEMDKAVYGFEHEMEMEGHTL